MREIDPGHVYELDHLDGDGHETLTFVKREGEGYPGNVGHHPGTNLQETLRACLARTRYLDNQIHDDLNNRVRESLKYAIWCLEIRAAQRHSLPAPTLAVALSGPTCKRCGHVVCQEGCHSSSKFG